MDGPAPNTRAKSSKNSGGLETRCDLSGTVLLQCHDCDPGCPLGTCEGLSLCHGEAEVGESGEQIADGIFSGFHAAPIAKAFDTYNPFVKGYGYVQEVANLHQSRCRLGSVLALPRAVRREPGRLR